MQNTSVRIRCPKCDKTYRLPGLSLGQKARCHCGHAFTVTQETLANHHSTARDTAPEPDLLQDDPVKAVQSLARAKTAILNEVGKIIVGQREVLEQIMCGFFAGGHCLLMGVPGLAKTLMVNCLSQAMLLDFKRIQFTPDLMPTDITGTTILEEDPDTHQRRFAFHQGPIFTHVLLADEINRTPPKTQAALLEAMQEHRVTASGHTHRLPAPFLVLATQNPLELEGTYPLPEAQLDRFIFLIKVNYPDFEAERKILQSTTAGQAPKLKGILDEKTILSYQRLVRQVPISEHVAGYAARLCRATRPQCEDSPDFIKRWVRFGCGPRAGQSLILAAKAHVVLNGRTNVACEDVRQYCPPVMRHRIILNFTAASEGLDTDEVIGQLLEAVPEA